MHSCKNRVSDCHSACLCHLSLEKRLSDDFWERRRQIRQKQKHADYMKWYGETLEGNLYKAETIIVEKKSGKKQKSAPTCAGNSGHAKASGKGKGKPKVRKKKHALFFFIY